MSGLFVSVVGHRVRRWIWVVVHGGGVERKVCLGLKVPGSERYERIRTTFGGERDFFKLWGWMGLPYGPVRVVLGCSRTRILCG